MHQSFLSLVQFLFFFFKEGSLVLSAVPALDGLTARYFKILKDFCLQLKRKKKCNKYT